MARYRDYGAGIAARDRDIELSYSEPEQMAPEEPSAPAASLAARYPSIVEAYERYLGRTPSDAEILGQTGNGTFQPGDMRIQLSVQSIAQSPEARTYAAQAAQAAQPAEPAAPEPPAPTAQNGPRETPAPAGVDPEKWAKGHTSPKYAFMDVSRKYDQRTPEGRQQTLAELQAAYPQWFSGWVIDGDKLRHQSGPLHEDFDGYNEFDAWIGSKAGTWAPAWQPTQRGGEAYVDAASEPAPAAAVAAPSQQPTTTTPEPSAPQSQPSMDVDWFAANLPTPEPYTTPAPPSYMQEQPAAPVTPVAAATTAPTVTPPTVEDVPSIAPYTTPERPDVLQTPYVPPTFTAPGAEDLYGDPGYWARLQTGVLGRDRMAASRGSILSGGHGKAIERYAQEFANNEYKDLYGRRFGEFQTQAGLGANARQMNESEYQNLVGNAMSQFNSRQNQYQNLVNNASNQYATRYKSYRDAIGDQFRLAELGLSATTAGRY